MVIAVLGVLGVLSIAVGSPFGSFDLDGERNVPATYSAALWFAVAVVALLLGRIDPAPGLPQVWAGLAIFFVLVSADEFGEIHERLERIVGIDWQILYSPVALIALVLWLFVARRLREIGVGLGLLLLGTVGGIASQVAEAVEYGPSDERIGAFDELVVFEEVVEMVGALLIGLALLTALQALNPRARAYDHSLRVQILRRIFRRPQPLPEPGEVPRSVAIILDGNGRWAEARALPVEAGHREGTRALRRADPEAR